jgi:hypothetical protein
MSNAEIRVPGIYLGSKCRMVKQTRPNPLIEELVLLNEISAVCLSHAGYLSCYVKLSSKPFVE